MADLPKEPIEGFDFIDYDQPTKVLTVRVDGSLLLDKSQEAALARRAVEILQFGDEVSGVTFVPR